MKKIVSILLPALFLLTGCSIEQTDIGSRVAATRAAIVRGEAGAYLSEMEAKAFEAESKQNWYLALVFYRDAAQAAAASGQLQKAVSYRSRELELAEKTKDQERIVLALDGLATIHRTLRQYEKAREWTEKGIEVTKKLPPGPYREAFNGFFNRYLGDDFLRRGDLQKAIEYLSYSVQVQESRLANTARSGNPVHLSNSVTFAVGSLSGLAKAHQQAGNIEDAIKGYQRGLDLITRFRVRISAERGLHQGLGQIYLSQGDFPRALESLTRSLTLAESQQSPTGISSASRGIGDVFNQTRQPARAVPYYQKAIQHIESTRSLLQSEEYKQSFFEGGLDAYVSMIGVLLESGRADAAFNYSERARSRSFLDLLGNKAQLSRLTSGLLEEERALQARIAASKARLAGDEAEAVTDRKGLQRDLADAEKAYTAFLVRVRKQDKEQASLMAVEPLTLKEVQNLLDPATTLVEYFVTDSEVYVWVVEKDKLHFQKVGLAKDKLAGLVKTLRESIFALGERDKFNELSAGLHKSLIAPVLPHVTGKELIIVPHDVLHYLPFHALVGPDGRYLIEKYPIYYLSSASLLQFVKEKRRAHGDLSAVLAQARNVLAFGNPDLGDPDKDLEFAELEAQEVKAAYPETSVYLRKEATEEKSKALSPNHDIIHFATHAELNENDPLSSAVLLAKSDKEDGRLEVREIFGMDLKANLVVLSGCETGLGKLSTGDELVGLTRAFIYAGTPSVVASLWKVDDSSTAHLMSSFYKNLKTMTKVEALRQAQLALIRGKGRSDLLARRGIGGIGRLGETPSSVLPAPSSVSTSHPYFWAPFILVGDGK